MIATNSMLLFNFFTFVILLQGEGNGTPLQYSCLENPMDRGAWWAAVHGVAKSRTRLSDFTLTFHFHALEKEMATHSSVLAWRIPGTGAWWATISGVAQSRTRLKRLSTSSSILLQSKYVFFLFSQILDRGTECRRSTDPCDFPEFCNGISEFCVPDMRAADLQTCNNKSSYCFRGICQDRTKQCVTLFGKCNNLSFPLSFIFKLSFF